MDDSLRRLQRIIDYTSADSEMMEFQKPRSGYSVQQIVNELVECATVKMDALNEPDWETNMKICDLLNSEPESYCLTVAKAIQKQMKNHRKDPRVMWLTMILLDTCVKNCGPFFHRTISDKDFVENFKKTAAKRAKTKKDKSKSRSSKDYQADRLDEKVLRCILAWSILNPVELRPYEYMYEKMRKKGVIFPELNPEDKTPMKVKPRRPSVAHTARSETLPTDIKQRTEEVKSVVTVLESIILAETGKDLSQNDLAVELRDNCVAQKTALTDLIQKYSNEGNESNLDIVLLLFDRVERVLASFDGVPTEFQGSHSESDEEEKLRKPTPSNSSSSTSGSAPKIADNNPFRKEALEQGGGVYRTPEEIGLDILASVKTKETKPRQEDPLLDWLLK